MPYDTNRPAAGQPRVGALDDTIEQQPGIGPDPGPGATAQRLRLTAAGPLLCNATAVPRVRDGDYFAERLQAELSRCTRHDQPLAVALVEEIDGAPGAHIGEGLRAYDVVCEAQGRSLLILPGAGPAACAVVVARLRQRLEGSRVAVGTACFSADGSSAAELVAAADRSLERDRTRQLEGRVELDRIPPSMVEGLERDNQETTVWFRGLPKRLPVQVLRTQAGVRLKLPLSFLRSGREFRIDADAARPLAGVVREVMLSRYRALDDSPVVYLDVSPD